MHAHACPARDGDARTGMKQNDTICRIPLGVPIWCLQLLIMIVTNNAAVPSISVDQLLIEEDPSSIIYTPGMTQEQAMEEWHLHRHPQAAEAARRLQEAERRKVPDVHCIGVTLEFAHQYRIYVPLKYANTADMAFHLYKVRASQHHVYRRIGRGIAASWLTNWNGPPTRDGATLPPNTPELQAPQPATPASRAAMTTARTRLRLPKANSCSGSLSFR